SEEVERILDLEFPDEPLLELAEGGPVSVEGLAVGSVLDALPKGSPRPGQQLYNAGHRLVEGMLASGVRRLRSEGTHLDWPATVAALENAVENQPEGIGQPVERLLQVPHLQQEKTDYCVIACLDMLLKFHKAVSPAGQDAIAALLSQDPVLYKPGGVLPEK